MMMAALCPSFLLTKTTAILLPQMNSDGDLIVVVALKRRVYIFGWVVIETDFKPNFFT